MEAILYFTVKRQLGEDEEGLIGTLLRLKQTEQTVVLEVAVEEWIKNVLF